PLFATPAEAARQAVENDVHVLGVSSLAAAHLTLVPQLKAALVKEGRDDIMIVVGGVVPPQDYDELKRAGAEAIFPPGTVIAEAAEALLHKLNQRLGHEQQAAECAALGKAAIATPIATGSRAKPCRRAAGPPFPILPVSRAVSARASAPPSRAPSRSSRAGARIIRRRRVAWCRSFCP